MDEPKKGPTWLEFALVIAILVVIVIAALILLGPQLEPRFGHGINQNLWLHVGGL